MCNSSEERAIFFVHYTDTHGRADIVCMPQARRDPSERDFAVAEGLLDELLKSSKKPAAAASTTTLQRRLPPVKVINNVMV